MKISIIDFHQSSPSATLKMKTVKDSSKKQTVSNNNKIITRTTTTTTNFFNSNPSQHQYCSSFTVNKPVQSPTQSQLTKNMSNGQLACNRGKTPQRKTNNISPTSLSPQQTVCYSPNMLPNVMPIQPAKQTVTSPQPRPISPPTQQDQQFRWTVTKPSPSPSSKIIKSSHQSRKNQHMYLSQVPTLIQEHQNSSLPTLMQQTRQDSLPNYPYMDSQSANLSNCLPPTKNEIVSNKNYFSFEQTPIIENVSNVNSIPNVDSTYCTVSNNLNSQLSNNVGCKPAFRTSISLREILN